MAKAKKEKDVEATVEIAAVEIASEPKGAREARWEEFLAKHKAQNPAKYAVKEANGEFAKIPDSFK